MTSTSQLSLPLTSSLADSPASPIPLPGNEQARRMTATSGRECLKLSRLSGPLGSLVKMLMDSDQWSSSECLLEWSADELPAQRTVTTTAEYMFTKSTCCSNGYAKTSKVSTTKSNRLLFRLRASTPRTSDTASSLWPTPSRQEFHTKDAEALERRREKCRQAANNGNGFGLTLGNAVTLALWRTPNRLDGCGTFNRKGKKLTGRKPTDPQVMLADEVAATLWPTLAARDYRAPNSQSSQAKRNADSTRGQQLPNEVADMIRGMMPPTSSDTTEEPVACPPLNPEFCRWLMGFPRERNTSPDTATE